MAARQAVRVVDVTEILAALWGPLGAALAGAAGILLALWRARRAGREDERARQDRARIEAMKTAKEAREDVDAMDDGSVRDRLAGWVRDRER